MLDVVADVEIGLGAARGRLVADGRDVVLEVDEASALVGLVGLRSLRALGEGLAVCGLSLHVRSGDRLLLRAGRDTDIGVLDRLLRLRRVRLSPRFALRSVFVRGASRP